MKKYITLFIVFVLFAIAAPAFAFEEVEITPHFSEPVETYHTPVEEEPMYHAPVSLYSEEESSSASSWATNPANPASPLYMSIHAAQMNAAVQTAGGPTISQGSDTTNSPHAHHSSVGIIVGFTTLLIIVLVIIIAVAAA